MLLTTPDYRLDVSGRGKIGLEGGTYAGHGSLLVDQGIGRPLPVGTDGVVECEAGGEDDGDGLVRGVVEPGEFAVVDEHGGEGGECVCVGRGWMISEVVGGERLPFLSLLRRYLWPSCGPDPPTYNLIMRRRGKTKGPVGDGGVLGSMEEELVSEHVQHVEARFTAAAKHQNGEVPINVVSRRGSRRDKACLPVRLFAR